MNQSYEVILAVSAAVVHEGKILLVRRKKTGFMDGYYANPGGHVEPKEIITAAVLRELKEETGLEANEEDLELFNVLQDENVLPKLYISFRFLVKKWSGVPKLLEPEKSDDIGWFSIGQPPKNTSPYTLHDFKIMGSKGVSFSRAQRGKFYKEI